MSLSRQQLARLVLLLDSPDCGCKVNRVPLCVNALRPCAERKKNGSCSCPDYIKPCEHILSKRLTLTDDEWAELLYAAFPKEYAPKLSEPDPVIAMDRETRVTALFLRQRKKQRLWSANDRITLPDAIGLEVENRRNGSTEEKDFASMKGRP